MNVAPVSVVIPTFATRNTVFKGLRAAIESAQRQSIPPECIFVVEDARPETSETSPVRALVAELRAQRPGGPALEYLCGGPFGGPAGPRNHAIRAATTEWIAFLDHDDVWESAKLQRQFEALAAHPDAVMVHTNARYMHPDNVAGDELSQVCRTVNGMSSIEAFLRGYTIMSTVMIRRKFLTEIGLLDEATAPCDDLDLLMQLGRARAEVVFVPHVCVRYFVSPESLSADRLLVNLKKIVVFEKHLKLARTDDDRWALTQALNHVRRIAAFQSFNQGRHVQAAALFERLPDKGLRERAYVFLLYAGKPHWILRCRKLLALARGEAWRWSSSYKSLRKNSFVTARGEHAVDLLLGGELPATAADERLLNRFENPTDVKEVLDQLTVIKRLAAQRRLKRLMRAGFLIPTERDARFAQLPMATVDLELTSHCQADCPICPRETMPRGHGFMSKEHFYRLTDELRAYRSTIYLCGIGESLLHPDFFEFLRHLRRCRFPVMLVTNGNLLTPENRRALIDCGLDYVSISIQGVTPETYKKTMNLPFDTTMQRIRDFISEARGKIPVGVSLVETPDNAAEIPEFRRLWTELGASPAVVRVHNRGGYLKDTAIHPHALDKPAHLHRCAIFNHRIFVAWNGAVLACCNDMSTQTSLGTIGETSLDAILQEKNRRIKVQDLFSICGTCDDPNRHRVLDPTVLTAP